MTMSWVGSRARCVVRTVAATRNCGIRCAVCADAGAGLWGRTDCYELYRCASCRVVFTHPVPSSDQLLRLYTTGQYLQGGGRAGYIAGYEVSAQSQGMLYEMILDQIGPPESEAKLLEVGCAEGHFLDAARKRGWEVCGVELSPSAAAAARSRFGVRVLEGHLEDQTLESSSCSVVVLLDVIEHLSDPARTVKTVARVLRPGGKLVIKTPDIGSAHARRLGARWEQIKPPEHLVYFDLGSMTRLLRSCGFELDRRRVVGGTGIVAAIRRCAQDHPALDRPKAIRTLIVIKRVRWVAWLLAQASALLGRRDSMVVFAHKVVRGADTSMAAGKR
jgi:SAM-dependent methyltransferase